jgi:hypothetical protein
MAKAKASVYLLRSILDDSRFEGFGCAARSHFNGDRLVDDFTLDDEGRPALLASVWRAPNVEGRVKEFNDLPMVNLLIPALSARAADGLRELLEPNGELLPLKSSVGRYYAYNVTTVAPAAVLDERKSKLVRFDDGRVMTIDRYEFRPRRLKGLTVFRIPQDNVDVYVTDAFAERVRELGLRGFALAKVWPLPLGENWMRLHKRESAKRKRQGLPKGRSIKGESVFVELELQDAKPNRIERRTATRLMDELDKLLFDAKSKKSTAGSLEGHEFDDGFCVLKLSCPDAAKLAKKLTSSLRTLKWPGQVTLITRNRGFDWVEAKETRVKIRRGRKADK